jgi:alginate O-acetyltransferase complex protein AlgI
MRENRRQLQRARRFRLRINPYQIRPHGLGGNRVSLTRKITNGLIAFAVCGLWHGAGWNFIVWGLYHGIGITVNNLWNERFGHYSVYSWLRIPNRVFCWSLNIFFVFVGWVIFFYDLPKAMTILRLLWGFK